MAQGVGGCSLTFRQDWDWIESKFLGKGSFGECWSANVLNHEMKRAGCSRLCVKTVCRLFIGMLVIFFPGLIMCR